MSRNTAAVLRTFAFCALVVACSDDSPNTTLTTGDLPESGTTESGGWESAPLPTASDCEGKGGPRWAEHGRSSKTTIEHALGRAPSIVLPYVSFSRNGCGGTLASGDAARISSADDKRVVVQNATQEDFFLRLVLQ